jgi:hypothetical protein
MRMPDASLSNRSSSANSSRRRSTATSPTAPPHSAGARPLPSQGHHEDGR